MRFRNWLLTGTSITLLALAPATAAHAQDATNPDLVAAYQAYTADQSDENKTKLNEACIAAGFQSFDDCVAALAAAAPAPAPAPAPAEPSSEAAPPPADTTPPPADTTPPPADTTPPPADTTPPPADTTPPPADTTTEAAPPADNTPPPAEPSSEAAPAQPAALDISADLTAAVQLYNKGAADIGAGNTKKGNREINTAKGQIDALCQTGGFADTDSCLAQFGLALDPIPEPPAPSSEEAAPAPASSEPAAPPASSSEEAAPAPASSEPAAPPASSSEEAAPASSSEQAAPATSSEQQPANDALAQLTAAVDLYNQGVADLIAGDAGGRAKIDQARPTILKICTDAGFSDTNACLAQFGLTLNPLPPQPGEPSSSEAAPAPSSEAPAPASSSEVPISELPNASEAVTPSAVEVLPPEIKPEQAAPILDSAKDEQKQPDQGQPAQPNASSSSEQPPAPSEPPAPPPADDKQAQADITPPPADQQSAVKDKGKKIEAPPVIQIVPPQNTEVPVKVIQAPAPKPPQNGNPPPVQNNGVIIQIGINIVINNPEQERDRIYDPRQDQIYYEDLGRGRTRETIERPDGSKIVTVRNRNGDILQRSKITPRGREIILATYDPRDRDIDSWKDPGDDLPPLRLTIPAQNYILDADTADEGDVYNFLDQPPVEKVRRIYTIDEVKRSARLRDSVRRLEVGGLTFDSGKATIARSQVGALSKVADAMQKMLDRDPGEVFLIEGHTDAVGSDVSNLVLSDQRAATVARILSDFYDIPPENLVTQGYGERYLKVKTDQAEPLNRRVVIKRITPLISYASN